MIVRIASEGQFELADQHINELNDIDNRLVEVVNKDDEQAFEALLAKMVELVRREGKPVPPEELKDSQLILPPPDITLEEAKKIFVGDGILPG